MGNWTGSGRNQPCLEELNKTTKTSLKAVRTSSRAAGDGLCDCSLSTATSVRHIYTRFKLNCYFRTRNSTLRFHDNYSGICMYLFRTVSAETNLT
jgi:hypothetical protein